MGRRIKLSESDLLRIVKKVLNEQTSSYNPKGLKFGDRNEDVKILQKKLMDGGFLKTKSMTPTGYFGPLTKSALDKAEGKTVTNTNKQKTTQTNTQSYLLFDGNNLSFIDGGKVIKKWKAYSGRTKWNAFGDKQIMKYVDTMGQDPKQFMKIGNQGPIPMGDYLINQVQKRSKPSLGAADELCSGKNYNQLASLMMKSKTHDWNTGTTGDLIAWGDYRCPIINQKGTDTFGRGSFYIHGGGIAGSIGCIDLLLNMKDFVNTFESWKSRTKNNSIKLVVKY